MADEQARAMKHATVCEALMTRLKKAGHRRECTTGVPPVALGCTTGILPVGFSGTGKMPVAHSRTHIRASVPQASCLLLRPNDNPPHKIIHKSPSVAPECTTGILPVGFSDHRQDAGGTLQNLCPICVPPVARGCTTGILPVGFSDHRQDAGGTLQRTLPVKFPTRR